MAAASTVEARGRQQVAELLHRTAKWLHAEQQHQRWQTIVVRRLGGLARLGGFAELEATAQRMLLDAPASAFWSGVITNLPDLTVLVRRELPDDAALAMEFPEYVGDVALKFVRGEFAPHIQLTLEGRLTEAADHVTNERYAEEYASTCAVLGTSTLPSRSSNAPTFQQAVRAARSSSLASRATDSARMSSPVSCSRGSSTMTANGPGTGCFSPRASWTECPGEAIRTPTIDGANLPPCSQRVPASPTRKIRAPTSSFYASTQAWR
jgi:hypothetical protein